MTNLPRLRVKEVHGIRRFLYPLEITVMIPADVDLSKMALQTHNGLSVPYCTERLAESQWISDELTVHTTRLQFAISIGPLEVIDLTLTPGSPEPVPDGLQFRDIGDDQTALRSTQQRLTLDISDSGCLSRVVYDGIDHLRSPFLITMNGADLQTRPVKNDGMCRKSALAASVETVGSYDGGTTANITTEITACKSWAHITHTPHNTKPGDIVAFALPFAAVGDDLLCDFGAGGGVYMRLGRKPGLAITWTVDDKLIWTLKNGDRVDFQGRLSAREQAWFHVVDAEKSLAVALTEIPDDCEALSVRIDSSGDIVIGYVGKSDGTFGVCYHFLNGVPAVAAATNPQSIILRPIVEEIL